MHAIYIEFVRKIFFNSFKRGIIRVLLSSLVFQQKKQKRSNMDKVCKLVVQ